VRYELNLYKLCFWKVMRHFLLTFRRITARDACGNLLQKEEPKNVQFYLDVKKLQLRRIRWVRQDWFLLRENATANTELIVRIFLSQKEITEINHQI
jgi:hypothetical protein